MAHNQRIGIYGGSFDPVHNGHIILANHFIKHLNLDCLIIIPTVNAPHKDGAIADANHRYIMLKLAYNNIDKVHISDIEINRKGKSYTSDTILELRKLYQNDKLYLCMGEDMFITLDSWHKPNIIFEHCIICVVPRESNKKYIDFSYKFKENYNANIKIIKMEPIDISSTDIRNQLKQNKNAQSKLPKNILEYINKNNLYL